MNIANMSCGFMLTFEEQLAPCQLQLYGDCSRSLKAARRFQRKRSCCTSSRAYTFIFRASVLSIVKMEQELCALLLAQNMTLYMNKSKYLNR